jgi:hypothetical protein
VRDGGSGLSRTNTLDSLGADSVVQIQLISAGWLPLTESEDCRYLEELKTGRWVVLGSQVTGTWSCYDLLHRSGRYLITYTYI